MANDGLSAFAAIESSQAASSAREAADEARGARNASEERLEGGNHNPFLVFQDYNLETVYDGPAGLFGRFFQSGKLKLTPGRKLSIKRTDVSHLTETQDDFGTVYTTVHLEQRSQALDSEDGGGLLYVLGTMEQTQKYINSL